MADSGARRSSAVLLSRLEKLLLFAGGNQALHKSVAVYVDKKFRQPCTPENCYITRTGPFLPQPEELFSPGLRENRKDRQSWFPLTDEFLQDQKQLKQYLAVLLKSFL